MKPYHWGRHEILQNLLELGVDIPVPLFTMLGPDLPSTANSATVAEKQRWEYSTYQVIYKVRLKNNCKKKD